ncbi:hypothetical protein [Kribbella sp. CA-247076]|uniref:hypothetical protein n=1 Tax=Kribbella sp. CA-247076 TaxID=3239941 RepID=UPI003D8CDEF7
MVLTAMILVRSAARPAQTGDGAGDASEQGRIWVTLEIEHRLNEYLPGWERRKDPSVASSEDLLWYYFSGDVRIGLDDAVISSSVGSVPALHFAGSTLEACRRLVAGQAYEYAFTEVDEVIFFERSDDGSVTISSTLDSVLIAVGYGAFVDSVKAFVLSEVAMLTHRHPGLGAHVIVQKLLHEVQSINELG